jgi:hypothetical protein
MFAKMHESREADLKARQRTHFKKNPPSMIIAENYIGYGIQLEKQAKKTLFICRAYS